MSSEEACLGQQLICQSTCANATQEHLLLMNAFTDLCNLLCRQMSRLTTKKACMLGSEMVPKCAGNSQTHLAICSPLSVTMLGLQTCPCCDHPPLY